MYPPELKSSPYQPKKQKNFTSKFLIFLLNVSGIPFEWQTGKLEGKLVLIWKYYLLYAFIFLTSSQIILLKDTKNLYNLCVYLIFIFNGIFLNATTIALHVKKQDVMELMNIFDRDFIDMAQESGYPQKTNDKFKAFFSSYGVAFFIVFGAILTTPFFLQLVSGDELGDVDTLLIPSWFPWGIDTYPKYLSTIVLQSSWLAAVSIPITQVFMFTSYFVIEVESKVEMLEDVANKINDQDNDDGAYRDFETFIRYHQVIWRFIHHFCSCYSLVFATNLVYSAANLTLVLLALNSGDRTIPGVMQLATVFLMVMSYLYLYCYIGEVLHDTDMKFRSMLYNTGWFKRSIKFKKLFIIFLLLAQHNSNLKVGTSYVASFRLLAQVLRMSYSYFNVLSKT